MQTNLLKFRAFTEIAATGSFSRAAEVLGTSQSGISRMISDLEKEWGFRLFERDRNGVTITKEGQRILPEAKALCSDLFRLEEAVSEIRDLECGHIVIGTFSSVATHWLPNMIRKFSEDHPDISYELLLGDYSELRKWIEDDTVDFAFTSLEVSEDLETEFIEDDELVAVIPRTNPYADAECFPMKALEQFPFMLLEKGGRAEISHMLDEEDIHPNICFRTWDDYSVMSMVENGLGISILPRLILRRIPYDVRILPLEHPHYRHICVAKKAGRTPSLASRKFLEYLDMRNGQRCRKTQCASIRFSMNC